MCGIIGMISGQPERYIRNMVVTIEHRGPDDCGYFLADKIALGHRRLSILDLSENGHQPMISADGNWVIVYNGEIYNHLDIREELVKKGCQFISTSDTETLLYGYIHFKEEILQKLNGIFAFAIYNKENEEIFVARDHLGVKPLYYYFKDDSFIFGSEIKSFLSYDHLDKAIDPEALVNYINYLWSPGSKTAFKYVNKLLPGHYLKFSIHRINIQPVKYYEIPFNGIYNNKSEETIIDELEEKLLKAVDRQLLADVPVGFFLSGGLDSSLLVAIAKKLHPERKIQTFTINTKEVSKTEGFSDDLYYADLVAKHLQVDLEIIAANVDILRDFDKMIWHLDEPQADAAPLNVLNISYRAKEMGYKVLIGGAAGDDLFSGYRRHQALNFEKYFANTPLIIREIIKSVIDGLPGDNARLRRIKKLFANIDQNEMQRILGYFSWIPLDVNFSLFNKKYQEIIKSYDPLGHLSSLLEDIPNEKNRLNQLLFLELKSFLVDHNLNYTDKLSMATGVEVRVPYLDLDLVEFSTKIPPSLKMKGQTTKYILKKLAERYLPKEVIYRKKAGFGAPVRKWVTNDLDDKINQELNKENIEKRGLFDYKAVQKLIADNKAGKIDASYTVLSLLAIESWCKQYVFN